MSHSRRRRLLDLLLLGRPHFLIGGVGLYALGLAMARYYGAHIDAGAAVWGQVAVFGIQMSTHYSNDYFDLAGDRVHPGAGHWSGGSRILVDGRLPPWAALLAAIALSVLAVVALTVLRLGHAAPLGAVAAGLVALALSWGYSAPPLRLHSRGLGEVMAALLVTGMTPLFSFVLQVGHLEGGAVLATLPVCGAGFALLLSVAFPDVDADAAVGKRTLVVRLGRARAARLYTGTLACTYAVLPLLPWLGVPAAAALLPAIGLPLAAAQAGHVWRGATKPPAALSAWAFRSVILLGITIAAEIAAFVAIGTRVAQP
ncbi:MAG: prenyltransferase [Chloroflexota bacterium]